MAVSKTGLRDKGAAHYWLQAAGNLSADISLSEHVMGSGQLQLLVDLFFLKINEEKK